MSDLLAKCDWHGDELRVELPQWPEVVTVWVDGKAEPFVPVTDPDALGAIKCLQGLADATSDENKELRRELELDTFRGLGEIEAYKREASVAARKLAQAEAENEKLRELVRDMARAWWACDNERCPHGSSCDAAVSEGKLADCEMERRMAELGIEVEP